jgi:hypothetical protein
MTTNTESTWGKWFGGVISAFLILVLTLFMTKWFNQYQAKNQLDKVEVRADELMSDSAYADAIIQYEVADNIIKEHDLPDSLWQRIRQKIKECEKNIESSLPENPQKTPHDKRIAPPPLKPKPAEIYEVVIVIDADMAAATVFVDDDEVKAVERGLTTLTIWLPQKHTPYNIELKTERKRCLQTKLIQSPSKFSISC